MSENFSDSLCLSSVCPDLEILRCENKIPELQLIASNEETVGAHRIVLAARLPYFQNLKLGDMKGNNMSINLDLHSKNFVETIVKYAYTGEITISDDNVEGLLHLALCLKVYAVEKWCISFVIERQLFALDQRHLHRWMTFSVDNNCIELQTTCINHMQQIFEEVIDTPLLTSLSLEHFLTLLRSDDLVVNSEDSVVNAIEKWAVAGEHGSKEKTRFDHVAELLTAVRWKDTSRDFRFEKLVNSNVFREKKFSEILLQIEKQLINPQSSNTTTVNFNSTKRKCEEIEKKKKKEERQKRIAQLELELEEIYRSSRKRKSRNYYGKIMAEMTEKMTAEKMNYIKAVNYKAVNYKAGSPSVERIRDELKKLRCDEEG